MLRADILDCIDAFCKFTVPNLKSLSAVYKWSLSETCISCRRSFPLKNKAFLKKLRVTLLFSARAFRHLAPEVVELTKIYRQSDHDFIELLSRIRSNSITDADVTLLNSRLNATKAENRYENFCISLTTTNNLSDSINSRELEALEGRLHISQAVIDGNFRPSFILLPKSSNSKPALRLCF